MATAQQSGQTLDKQLSEACATMEKYLRDYDTLFNRTQKLTEDLEDQVGQIESLFWWALPTREVVVVFCHGISRVVCVLRMSVWPQCLRKLTRILINLWLALTQPSVSGCL